MECETYYTYKKNGLRKHRVVITDESGIINKEDFYLDRKRFTKLLLDYGFRKTPEEAMQFRIDQYREKITKYQRYIMKITRDIENLKSN
jgi:hypothetical protein